MRLQGCAGFLVTDTVCSKINRINVWLTYRAAISKPLVLSKPGPSQGQKPSFELYTPPRKDVC